MTKNLTAKKIVEASRKLGGNIYMYCYISYKKNKYNQTKKGQWVAIDKEWFLYQFKGCKFIVDITKYGNCFVEKKG